MYCPLNKLVEIENSQMHSILQGVLSGVVKTIDDGEQLLIKEDEYRLKKEIFRYL